MVRRVRREADACAENIEEAQRLAALGRAEEGYALLVTALGDVFDDNLPRSPIRLTYLDAIRELTAKFHLARVPIMQRFAAAVIHVVHSDTLQGADLSNRHLGCAELTGADLRDAVLQDSNLYNADLSGARLQRANLHSVDLSGADLTGASFEQAVLTRANLRAAVLRCAKLTGAHLDGVNLIDADLSGARLNGATVRGALWNDATRWPEGFEPTTSGCLWVGPHGNLKDTDLANASLTSLDLTGANLSGANLSGAHLNSTSLRYACLQNASMKHAHLFSCDLSGCDLANACLVDASYTDLTQWPTGFDPRAGGARRFVKHGEYAWVSEDSPTASGDLENCD